MDLLARFPRTALAHLPTPLEPCAAVSDWLGGPDVWIKRDDQTGLGGGGNKLRKLCFDRDQGVCVACSRSRSVPQSVGRRIKSSGEHATNRTPTYAADR